MEWYPCSYSGGDWDSVLDIYNYPSKIGRINNRLTLDHGSYVGAYTGTNGSTGYVNFARIKIIDSYPNYPCVFVLGGRGRPMPMIVGVNFQSVNTNDPALAGFYKMFVDSYEVYIYKTATSQWDLYAPKNEAWGRIDILDLWYSTDHFSISFPNAHVATLNSAWARATMYGNIHSANSVIDYYNGNTLKISLGAAAVPISSTSWLAGFVSGSEIRAINRADFIQAKMLNNYYGMCYGNYQDDGWIRTTQSGLIPYQQGTTGSGHCSLGTSTWSFAKAYIDKIVTRSINFNDTIPIIEAFGDGDGAGYGCELVITGRGNTFIGAGEAPEQLRTALQAAVGSGEAYGRTAENLYVASDGNIYIYSNANTIGNRKGIVFDSTGVLRPLVNSTQSIGTSTCRFSSVHAQMVQVNSIRGFNNIYASSAPSYHTPKMAFEGDYIQFQRLDLNSTGSVTNTTGVITIATSSQHFPVGIFPGTNNTGVIGAQNYKWNQFWATNGSIQTSDKNEKEEVSYIGKNSDYDTYMDDETLKSFIQGLLPVIYKRINGESGRPHHGFIAQDIEELLQELNIKDHAGFIKSPKTENIEVEEEVEEEYTDEVDGQVKTRIVTQKREEQREIPGEYIYGLRYEEFIADIVRFVQILYDRNTELENALEEQKKKAENLEKRIEALENIIKQTA